MKGIDTTKLYGVRPIKIFNNCKVTDLDPLSTATTPRLIAVQMPDADGATMHAMWSGFPTLAVNDYVRCIRDTSDTNILYVLGTGGATATSGGGAWPQPGTSIIGATEYDDFKTAIAAAGVGDEIRVGAGTDTSVDANQDLINHHVVGSQSGSTIISVRATLTAALDLGSATYSDFEVLQTGNSASRLDTITLEANVILKNIKVTGTNAGAGVCRTIYVNDAGGFLINVHAEADEHALFVGSFAGTTVVQGGYYKSTAAHAVEVAAGASGTVILAGPVLDGSSGPLQETSGTVLGWYYDVNGSIYYLIGSDASARVRDSGSQTISDTTWTTINFDTEDWDTDAIHDTVTNNTRLTCKTAGKYIVSGQLTWANNATGRRGVRITKNGSTTVEEILLIDDAVAAGGDHHQNVTTIISLSVNDYIELWGIQTSGGNLGTVANTKYSPEFMMAKLPGPG